MRVEDSTDDTPMKPAMYRHDAGDLFAKDVDPQMALLPEIIAPTEEMAVYDIQCGDLGVPLTEDQENLRQLI
uniref:Uncharacterized protein n=1 Tax=Peronospora matthiolae TaxID=2874970 RepID=A0AAV1UHT9_9STRA